jgi:hypothetical protein
MLLSATKISSVEEKLDLLERLFEKNAILIAYEYAQNKNWKQILASDAIINAFEIPEDKLYTIYVPSRFIRRFKAAYRASHPARCIRSLTISEKENFAVCAHGLPPMLHLRDFTQREILLSKKNYISEKLNGMNIEIFKHQNLYIVKNKQKILLASKDLEELNVPEGTAVGARIRAFLDYLERATRNQQVLTFVICAPRKQWRAQYAEECGSENSWLSRLNINKTTSCDFIPVIDYPETKVALTGIVNFPYTFYPQDIVDDLARAFDIPRPALLPASSVNLKDKNVPAPPNTDFSEGYVLHMHNSDVVVKNISASFELQAHQINTIGKSLGVL